MSREALPQITSPSDETNRLELDAFLSNPVAAEILRDQAVAYLKNNPAAREEVLARAQRALEVRQTDTSFGRKTEKRENKTAAAGKRVEGRRLDEKELTDAIGNAMNFPDLYDLIMDQGGLPSTDGQHFFKPAELIARAERYRSYPYKNPPVEELTRARGFRDRVVYLHDIEKGFGVQG